MRLTVLGSSASQPAAGDASSGYLFSEGGAHVLVDCGSGVLGNLLQHVALKEISGIVISHMHPDHYIDLIAMRYGLRYGEGGSRPLDVYLPPGGANQLQHVSEAISKTQPFFDGVLTLREYEAGHALLFGALSVTPVEVVHGIRSFGMRLQAGDRSVAYSSDTVMCDEVEALAQGAQVLLAENALGGGAPDHHEPRTHLTSVEAGLIARHAGVETLVLSHFWHTAERARAQEEAAAVFSGNIVIARPHVTVETTARL